jgi:hypothetical protein
VRLHDFGQGMHDYSSRRVHGPEPPLVETPNETLSSCNSLGDYFNTWDVVSRPRNKVFLSCDTGDRSPLPNLVTVRPTSTCRKQVCNLPCCLPVLRGSPRATFTGIVSGPSFTSYISPRTTFCTPRCIYCGVHAALARHKRQLDCRFGVWRHTARSR